ncbi:MAG: metallophosphoesterase [Akkermansiaceae bacterium]
MERRTFIQLATAGSAVAAAGQSIAAEGKEDTQLAIGHPAVMAPRSDGMEIVWRVSGLAKGYVEFGETKDLGQVARGDDWGLRPAGKEVIRVQINNLKPGTTYHYRAVTESFDRKELNQHIGNTRTFRTLDPAKDGTKFSVWNDTHKQDATIGKLAEMTPASDFLLWNGDISNDWYKEGDVAESIITPGDVGKVDFTKNHPLVFLRGNHDLRGNLAYQVEDHVATPSGKPWCAFRSGPVAVICMDTGEDKPDDHPYLFGRVACEPMRKKQAEWLEKAIAQPGIKDAPYRLVFCHIPLRWTDEKTNHSYDHFSKRSRILWHDSLVKWGAQMVISGHTHRDAHIPASKEFPYAQLVSGGPKTAQARLITGNATAKNLTITMQDLSGKTTRNIKLSPLT